MNEPMDFDTAWDYMDKMGFPVIHLNDEQYNKLIQDIDNAESMREVNELFNKLTE